MPVFSLFPLQVYVYFLAYMYTYIYVYREKGHMWHMIYRLRVPNCRCNFPNNGGVMVDITVTTVAIGKRNHVIYFCVLEVRTV